MNWKLRFLVAIGLCGWSCSIARAEQGTIMSKEEIRGAITVFRQDPLSARGRVAGELVRTFAEKSDSVITNVNGKVAPFLSNVEMSKEDRTLLLDAFIIGSVDSQLLKNEKKDDPYGGITEVIQVYQQIQKQNPVFNLPEIDKLIAMEKRGELKKYVESP